MLKTALEKANSMIGNNHPKPAWQGDEEMLLKLCALSSSLLFVIPKIMIYQSLN
ncbi:hypothetical protein MFMK1_002735 [Metallumcola ferriviriculae]|uniref:Uncharacterized protein n=1 Tax=Metallumcola ferriviriculae TaxID=3039180 RepID=A0AAU0URN8_9FIRM|nr:hypothetical protein MFMK1_002735 [Desulfitibacteraceae bacterium MK1]